VRPDAEPAFRIFHGTALEGPAFRVVRKCPPTADDFLSYLLAGRGFPAERFFQATGVSMWTELEQAEKLARGGSVGTCVAAVDLNADFIYIAASKKTGHLTVWAPSRALVNRVIQCAEVKGGGS
jgi:hypothetical protein